MSIVTRGDPSGGRGRPGAVPGAGRGLLPGGGALRLHGDAGRARGAPRRSARTAATASPVTVSSWQYHVLSGARDADRRSTAGAGQQAAVPRIGPDGALAQEAVHCDDAERAVRHRVLQPSPEPGRGAGRPDSVLAHDHRPGLPAPPRRRVSAPRNTPARDSLAVTALGRARRGLRRHRHQPALRAQGVLRAGVRPRRRRAANVLGVLSLIFWSLNFVVSLKYLTFIMRADNRGEGGIMALLALLRPRRQRGRRAPRCWSGSACSARRCSTATA